MKGASGMVNIFAKIAEQKIQEAQARGEFDDLPGKGRPLELSDDSRVPEELRMAYKILKNAGCAPPELQLKNEILRLEDMLSTLEDEREKYRQLKKLNFLVTKLNLMRPRPVRFEEDQRYLSRLAGKITVGEKKDRGGENT
ncbi:MAG: DnaJ family domain-containing protein [Thermodesulfobacteriota bacterium]